MTKNKFTQNLTASNISSFKQLKGSVKKKVSLLITADATVMEAFKTLAFNYYKDRKILRYFNWNSFLRVCLLNMETLFSSQNKKITIPDEDTLFFYKKPSKTKSYIPERYTMSNPQKLSFTISREDLNIYYALMHSYYTEECADLTFFSVSYFFVDVVNIISKIPQDKLKDIKYE